jgi:hypothetical protein
MVSYFKKQINFEIEYIKQKKIQRALSEIPANWPIQPKRLSVEMACLLSIQNKIQAV